jgi:chromosome segregation ATPase
MLCSNNSNELSHSAHTNRSSSVLMDGTDLEDQYIKNLQHQVQFLEMELELQKKINEKTKEEVMHEAKPLERSIHELKLAFIQKEGKFENEIKQYKERIAALEDQIDIKEEENDSLKEQIKNQRIDFHHQIIKVTEDYVLKVVSGEKECTRLKKELEREREVIQTDLTNRIDKAIKENEKLENENRSQKVIIDDLMIQIKALQVSVEQWEQNSGKLQEKLVSLEQVDKNEKENLDNVEYMYEQVKQECGQLKLNCKQLEFDKEQLRNSKEKLEKQVQLMLEKQVELEAAIDKYKSKLSIAENQKDQLQKEVISLKQLVQSLKLKEQTVSTEREELKKRIEDLQYKLIESEKKFSTLQIQFKNLTNEHFSLDRDYKYAQNQINTLNKENEGMVTQYKLVDDRLKQFMIRDDRRQDNYDELCKKITILKAENRKYRRQLKLSGLLNSLTKSGDLQTIVNWNINAASKISDLLATMKDEDHITDDDLMVHDEPASNNADNGSNRVSAQLNAGQSFEEWFAVRKK